MIQRSKRTRIWQATLFVCAVGPASAADVSITPPPGGGFVVNGAGAQPRFRVQDTGEVFVPSLTSGSVSNTNLTCFNAATGELTPCAPGTGSGSQGPAGPSGSAGPAGPAGPAGATGAMGPAGPAGATGTMGPAGPAGAQGPQGPAGAVGPEGPQGLQGPQGIQGIQGPAGMTGPAGPATAAAYLTFNVPTTNTNGNGTFYLLSLGQSGSESDGQRLLVQSCTNAIFAARLTGNRNLTLSLQVRRGVDGSFSDTGVGCNLSPSETSCSASGPLTINAFDSISVRSVGTAAFNTVASGVAAALSCQ